MKESSDILIRKLTKIEVEPGDILYIQLPYSMRQKKLEAVAESIDNFFKGRRIKILIGQFDIKFTAIKEKKTKEKVNESTIPALPTNSDFEHWS